MSREIVAGVTVFFTMAYILFVNPQILSAAGMDAGAVFMATAIAAGLTNREAAARLFLSVKTIDFHLQQMYRKLGVRSRTELAVRIATHNPSGERR